MPYTDPSSISGLVRWGKADSLGLSNNTPVSSFTDSSGSGNHFIGSGTARPTFLTGIQNGLAAIQWNGTGNVLTCDGLSSTFSGTNTPFTFFWAGAFGTLTVTHQCLFIIANITGSQNPTQDLFYRAESFNIDADRRDDTGATEFHVMGFNPDTNWHTVILTFDGTNSKLYVDGVLVNLSNNAVGTLTMNSMSIGAHRRVDATSAFFAGYWGEDGFYTSALSGTSTIGAAAPAGTDVYNTHNYLITKWATSSPTTAWIPYNLGASLVGWFRDDSWGFIANNAANPTWNSKSFETVANEIDLTGNGTYKTGLLNSKAGIQLDGVSGVYLNDSFASVATGISAPFTVFGTFQATSLSSASEVFGFGNSGGTTQLHRLQLATGPNQYRIDRRGNAAVLVTAGPSGTADTSAHSFIHSYDGSNVTLVIDGVKIFNAASLSTGANTLNEFAIGAFRRSGGQTEFMTGNFLECGIVNTNLSAAQITSLAQYQHNYWGTPYTGGLLLSRRRKMMVAA